jgi:hypothetical protein
MSAFDRDDYERACRSWAATRPQELQLWRLLADLLRDRDGWRFETDDHLGPAPLVWCFGSTRTPLLTVRAQADVFTRQESGTDQEYRFESPTQLLKALDSPEWRNA